MIAVVVLAATAQLAFGCVHEYGTVEEAHAAAGDHFSYGYNGLEWGNRFAQCRGKRQSPVLLPAAGAAAKALGQPDAKSSFSYGTLTNPKIVNNGHTLQVVLPADFKSDVKIPIKGSAKTATGTSVLNGAGEVSYVKATPMQFHFHAHSEHVISGAEYPMELHIVHFIKPDQLPACAPKGCSAVLGVLLALTDNEAEVKPELRRLTEAMPLAEGQSGVIKGDLDVMGLLPADKTYFTYEGSLTTPPCTEGILWHVLSTPLKISQSLLTKYEEAVGDTYCPEKKKQLPVGSEIVTEKGQQQAFKLPPVDARGCIKLANGHNCRAVQPTNNRPIKLATF